MRNAALAAVAALACLPPAARAANGTVTKTLALDGNGTLVAPANFWAANHAAIASSLNATFAPAGNYVSASGGNATNLTLSGNVTFGNSTAARAALGLGSAATASSTAFAASGSLSTVATTGNYSDLAGRPTIGTAASSNSTDFATSAQGALAATALQPGASYTNISGLGTAATMNATAFVPSARTINGIDLSANRTLSDLGIAAQRQTVSGNVTAGLWGRYTVDGNATFTDPSGSAAGQIYSVVITGNGTATLGGSNYTKSRLEVIRAYNGSSWSTLPLNSSDPVSFGGNLSVNGNTTLGDASGDTITITGQARGANQLADDATSYMTRSLVDARISMGGPLVCPINMALGSGTTVSGGSANGVFASCQGATSGAYWAANGLPQIGADGVVSGNALGPIISFAAPHTLAFFISPSGPSPVGSVVCRIYLGQATTMSSGILGAPAQGYGLRITRLDASNWEWRLTCADGGTVTGATNASPIVITKNAHGYSNGQVVEVTGVTGNTAANGVWTIANVSGNTFELAGSTGNGAYVSGGISARLSAPISSPQHAGRRVFLTCDGAGTVALRLGSLSASPSLSLAGCATSIFTTQTINLLVGIYSTGSTAYEFVSISNPAIIQN